MLRASAHGLHGGPHVFVRGNQVPARGQELAAANAAAFVDLLRRARMQSATTLPQAMSPSPFTTAVRLAALEGLLGKQRGVNPAVDDPCAALARHPAHFIAAQGVAGVDADAHDVARL